MLRIKYFEAFKEGQPFVVVTGDREGLARARDFFSGKPRAFLNDEAIVEWSALAPLQRQHFLLNEDECRTASALFDALLQTNMPGHVYFNTQALGNEIEVILSYKEYDDLLR